MTVIVIVITFRKKLPESHNLHGHLWRHCGRKGLLAVGMDVYVACTCAHTDTHTYIYIIAYVHYYIHIYLFIYFFICIFTFYIVQSANKYRCIEL